MLFNENDYGKRISEELSEIIKKHTTQNRWADLVDEFSQDPQKAISLSLVKNVIYRTTSLTERSAPLIEQLFIDAKGRILHDLESLENITAK